MLFRSLRTDAKWSNGTPVTAADFVFGWQRAVDPDVASEYAYMLSDIGQIKNAAEIIAGEKDKSELGVTAVDDNTLQVELNVPVSYFTSLMYFPTFYPVNEEFFTSCGDTFATSPETVLSNGAFVLDSYQPAATAFHLTKNADYYDTDRVKLSGLSYQVIQDSQQALMSFQTCGHKMLNLGKSLKKRVERGKYTCACCGKQFLPIRADARYCSNACRQKDYRHRKTAAHTSLLGT